MKLKRIGLEFLKVDGKEIEKVLCSEAIDILTNKTKPNTLYQLQIYQEASPCGSTYQYKDNKLCYEFSSNPDFNFANHSVPIEIIQRNHRWNWRYTIKVPIFEEVL